MTVGAGTQLVWQPLWYLHYGKSSHILFPKNINLIPSFDQRNVRHIFPRRRGCVKQRLQFDSVGHRVTLELLLVLMTLWYFAAGTSTAKPALFFVWTPSRKASPSPSSTQKNWSNYCSSIPISFLGFNAITTSWQSCGVYSTSRKPLILTATANPFIVGSIIVDVFPIKEVFVLPYLWPTLMFMLLRYLK